MLFNTDSYQESPWNCFVNGILCDLYLRSCRTSWISRPPCHSVNIFSCSCRHFEKMPLLLIWVGSTLYSWFTCPRDGGSSEVSWVCGHHLLGSRSEYWSLICCVACRSVWGRRMINIFLRNLLWHPLDLLWKSHHNRCWINERHIWAGICAVLWLQWRIRYIPWCLTSHTIGSWWGSVDENCAMPLLVYTRWRMGTNLMFGPRWSSH